MNQSTVVLDDYTYFSEEAIPRTGNAVVGKFCQFAGYVRIMGYAEEHNTRLISTYPFSQHIDGVRVSNYHFEFKKTTTIGNDVWFGELCYIATGVTVGDGAVIAAHAVVTKDVPPYAVVGGNPAKILRMRFSESEIVLLLEMKWWDWDLELIKKAVPLLTIADVSELYKFYLEEVKGR